MSDASSARVHESNYQYEKMKMEDSHKIKMNTMPSQPCSFDFRIYIDPRRTPVKFSIVCRFGIVATILSVSEHNLSVPLVWIIFRLRTKTCYTYHTCLNQTQWWFWPTPSQRSIIRDGEMQTGCSFHKNTSVATPDEIEAQ
jgi:hypothetical protein